MVSTLKKRQHDKRLLSQLRESDIDFMIRKNNHEAQTESRTNAIGESISLNNTNNASQVGGSQVDMHTLEENIVNKVRNQVNDVMTTVETRVQEAVLQ